MTYKPFRIALGLIGLALFGFLHALAVIARHMNPYASGARAVDDAQADNARARVDDARADAEIEALEREVEDLKPSPELQMPVKSNCQFERTTKMQAVKVPYPTDSRDERYTSWQDTMRRLQGNDLELARLEAAIHAAMTPDEREALARMEVGEAAVRRG